MPTPYIPTTRELAMGEDAYCEWRIRQVVLPRHWDELTFGEKKVWAKVALRVLKSAELNKV